MPQNVLSYADDTVVISSEGTRSVAKDSMNNMIENFMGRKADWFEFNKLALNTNKSLYIPFGNYFDGISEDIDINK